MRPNKLAQQSQAAMDSAQRHAEGFGHARTEVEHLLLALLEQRDGLVHRLLENVNGGIAVTAGQVRSCLERQAREVPATGPPYLGPRLRGVLGAAFVVAAQMNDMAVCPEHFLIAIRDEEAGEAAAILIHAGVEKASLLKGLAALRSARPGSTQPPDTKMLRGKTLEMFGRDLTAAKRSGLLREAPESDDVLEEVIQVLMREMKNNPLLIGDSGAGPIAIVDGLSRRIAEGDVPGQLSDKKIITLDMAALVKRAKRQGEIRERLTSLVEEITASAGEIILVIHDLHTFVGSSSEAGADLSNGLRTVLAHWNVRCIGGTTLKHYKDDMAKDASLERRFQPIMLAAASEDDAMVVYRRLEERYQKDLGCVIDESAVAAAASLSARYISGRFLPRKAIDALDEAEARLRTKINSLPTELDEANQRALRLEIEAAGPHEEGDPTGGTEV